MAQVTRPPPPNQTPPYAEETADSRIGIQTGFWGAQNITRTFRVYCANRSVSPIATLTSLSSRDGGVKLGESFPRTDRWSDGSYVVGFFTIVDHWIGTSVWIIQANYVPFFVTTFATQLWEFNIRGSLQSERVFTTLEYFDPKIRGDVPSKGIGSPAYTTKPTGDADFYANIPGRPPVNLYLAGPSNSPTDPKLARYMDGADAPKRVSTVNLWTVIPTWREDAVAAAMRDRAFVNADDVVADTTSGRITWVSNREDGRGTMILDEVSVDPVPPASTGLFTSSKGPAFRIGITLKFNPDGWQHHRRHTYKSDAGYESPIYRADGSFVDEEFRIAGETSISTILASFL